MSNTEVTRYPMFVAKFSEVFEELQYARYANNTAMVKELNHKLELLVKSATSVGVSLKSINDLFKLSTKKEA